VNAFIKGLLCLWVTAACQGPAPKRVQLELPEFVFSPDPVKTLLWAWDAQNERKLVEEGMQLSVEPSDLAGADDKGRLSCRRSGDGTVTATLSGVSNNAKLHCRLVDHLEAPEDLGRIDINDGPVRLDVGAYTKDGQKLEDVPLTITTRNSAIAKADGDKLVPLAVGAAKVEVRAGHVGREFSVKIVRRLKPEALPIDKDTRLHFSLDPGRYELVVELEQEKKLSAEWRGAPYCNYSGTAKKHTSVCVLRTKGGVAFDNPAYLNSGAKTVSHDGISLHEIPE
jgi:hypothetical protein